MLDEKLDKTDRKNATLDKHMREVTIISLLGPLRPPEQDHPALAEHVGKAKARVLRRRSRLLPLLLACGKGIPALQKQEQYLDKREGENFVRPS